jgi:hypothetical protein
MNHGYFIRLVFHVKRPWSKSAFEIVLEFFRSLFSTFLLVLSSSSRLFQQRKQAKLMEEEILYGSKPATPAKKRFTSTPSKTPNKFRRIGTPGVSIRKSTARSNSITIPTLVPIFLVSNGDYIKLNFGKSSSTSFSSCWPVVERGLNLCR